MSHRRAKKIRAKLRGLKVDYKAVYYYNDGSTKYANSERQNYQNLKTTAKIK